MHVAGDDLLEKYGDDSLLLSKHYGIKVMAYKVMELLLDHLEEDVYLKSVCTKPDFRTDIIQLYINSAINMNTEEERMIYRWPKQYEPFKLKNDIEFEQELLYEYFLENNFEYGLIVIIYDNLESMLDKFFLDLL